MGRLGHIILISSLLVSACTRELPECAGPQLSVSKIEALRKTLFSSGTPAKLAVPNPIDATQDDLARASDPEVTRALEGFNLQGLLNSGRLDNSLLKIRISSIDDDLSSLARPNSSGEYAFAVTDVHYSEAMAYYATQSIKSYVEALGFTYVTSRPLYVLVRAATEGGDEQVNAFYEHNSLDPSAPRVMKLFGNTEFAPGMDRDMYWHEMGHFANESVSREVGIDASVDHGAIYSEAAALHECMADFIAESLSGKPYIGKWINRNFEPNSPGKPLRSAVDSSGNRIVYDAVSTHDASSESPERYEVAEWCTRALWELRTQLVAEDGQLGAALADRLTLTAMSQLKKDTSFKEFHRALLSADEQLHCGLHKRSIREAFVGRGFDENPDEMKEPLSLSASPIKGTNTAYDEYAFRFRITNSSGVTARNVRIRVESQSAALLPTTYMQSFGDLPPGRSIVVGDSGLPLDFSVYASVDPSSTARLKYRLRVMVDNGPETVKDGEVPR